MMGLAIQELNAALALEEADSGRRDGSFSGESFGVIENLGSFFALHADHVFEHEPRLKDVGPSFLASVSNEEVALSKKGCGAVDSWVAWKRAHSPYGMAADCAPSNFSERDEKAQQAGFPVRNLNSRVRVRGFIC